MSLKQYVETYKDQYWISYPGNSIDTTHFVFNTNVIIQRVRVFDMRVRVSYAKFA